MHVSHHTFYLCTMYRRETASSSSSPRKSAGKTSISRTKRSRDIAHLSGWFHCNRVTRLIFVYSCNIMCRGAHSHNVKVYYLCSRYGISFTSHWTDTSNRDRVATRKRLRSRVAGTVWKTIAWPFEDIKKSVTVSTRGGERWTLYARAVNHRT